MDDNTQQKEQSGGIHLSEEVQKKFKHAIPLSSLASFPDNLTVYGQNSDEKILLFIRKDKIILFFNFVLQFLVLFLPFLVQYIISLTDNSIFNGAMQSELFFNSKYWVAILLGWLAYVLKGFYNIFFKWFYDINVLTTNRFVDLDLISIFQNRMEETGIMNIEDVKDFQPGIIQSLFDMGDIEIFTASGQTKFNLENVPQSHKIRDFIMDIVVEERKKYGNGS